MDDSESKATFVFKLPPKFTPVSASYGSPSILHKPLFADHPNKGEISHHGVREGIVKAIAVINVPSLGSIGSALWVLHPSLIEWSIFVTFWAVKKLNRTPDREKTN